MIDNQQQLQELITRAIASGRVAVDTEFVWERTYYPKLGLIQIGLSEDDVHLVDVPALKDLSLIKQLLESKQTIKIFHDAQGDLSILCRETGALPQNIYDTRLAAGFTGLLSTISLRNLLLEVLQIELDKTETRTDWLKRPLSSQQIDYALEDIRHLHKIYQHQIDKAQEKGMLSWMQQEMEYFNDNIFSFSKPDDQLYKKVKGVNSLNAREIAIVRELAALRDETAKSIDYPKGWVISDQDMLKLARGVKGNSKNLEVYRGHWGKNLEQFAPKLTACIEKALSLTEDQCPQPKLLTAEDKKIGRQASSVVAAIRAICEQRDLDPMLITSKKEVVSMIKKKKSTNILASGWRKELLGDSFCQDNSL